MKKSKVVKGKSTPPNQLQEADAPPFIAERLTPNRDSQARRPEPSSGDPTFAALQQLVELAAHLCFSEAAILVLFQNGTMRDIASAGLPKRIGLHKHDASAMPFGADDPFEAADLSAHPELRALARKLGAGPARSFLNRPVTSAQNYFISLMLFGEGVAGPLSDANRAALIEIAELMRHEVQGVVDLLTDPLKHVTIVMTLDDVTRQIAGDTRAAAVLNGDLTVVAANGLMADRFSMQLSDLVGMTYSALGSTWAEPLTFLFEQALKTRTAAPGFELITGDGEAESTHLVMVTPFSPLETKEYFLHVMVQDITETRRLETELYNRIKPGAPPREEPTVAFLRDTLVVRQTIRARKNISYLTIRSWRQPIRQYQITALKALKQNIPPELPHLIARELDQLITNLVGVLAFKAIVPIPCGHSQGETCLSVEIARALGARVKLPVIQAFLSQPQPGKSHPKENVTRPGLFLIHPVDAPVILVDDVATSGAHLEEAVHLLRPTSRSVLPVAWIGGDVSTPPEE